MRVVLDSNVVIAAFAVRGLCHAVFEYCLETQDVFACEAILKEISDKLVRKIKAPRSVAVEVDSYLREGTEVVRPAHVPPDVCRDKRDLIVLGTAEAAQAEYIVTGDLDLLSLERYGSTLIVKPRAFWEVIRSEKTRPEHNKR